MITIGVILVSLALVVGLTMASVGHLLEEVPT